MKANMMRASWFLTLVVAGGFSAAALEIGCSNESAVVEQPSARDAGPTDTGAAVPGDSGEQPAKDCYDNPKTHEEIINACTDAAKIEKHPTLPKLGPDGKLPPLP